MIKIGTRVKIKEHPEVVEVLWGRTGTIKNSNLVDREETRVFYGRTEGKCPDEVHWWVGFDEPIKEDCNSRNWTGVWITDEKYIDII